MAETGAVLATVGKDLLAALAKDGPDKSPDKVSGSDKVRPPRTVVPTTRRRPELDTRGLTGPEQRILNAIRWLEAIGVDEPEQPAVAFLAGYSFGGGAFNNPLGRLRSLGLIAYPQPGQAVALPLLFLEAA